MVALLKHSSEDSQLVQQRFLAMLPRIRRQAEVAFRRQPSEIRDELTQEVVAGAYAMFVRLMERGKGEVAYATPLAQFAIRQVRAGRRVGCRQNVHDIMWPCRLTIQQLDVQPNRTGGLNLLLFEDRHAGPAETAAARLDVAAWFRSLSPRNRKIARALADGEQTKIVAQRFGLTAGRISQLRAWFRDHWEKFQAGTLLGACAA
jgi:hypothetical protein